jgi:hypothetical protein
VHLPLATRNLQHYLEEFMATGIIQAIRSVVVDVDFPDGDLPEIYEALEY